MMKDRADFLNRVLHGTANSVIQYLDVAAPYVPPDCEKHLETLRAMKDEEAGQIAALYEMIDKLDAVPHVGAFDYWNVDLNYLDLRFLAGFAARHQEKVIREIEEGLDALAPDPGLYRRMRDILDRKRKHLETLREIAKKPEPAPAKPAKPAAKPAAKSAE